MSKRFIFSSVILLALFICALFAPYLSSFDPQHVEISNKLMAPDAVHLLGTDQLGRDVLSRLLHGARYSLFLSLTISLLEVVIGVTVGLLIGWYQGKAEATFLWFANVISAFPSFLLSLATVGILGQECQGGSLCHFCPDHGTLSGSYSQNSYPALYIQAYFDYCVDEYREYHSHDFWLFLSGNRCPAQHYRVGHDAA